MDKEAIKNMMYKLEKYYKEHTYCIYGTEKALDEIREDLPTSWFYEFHPVPEEILGDKNKIYIMVKGSLEPDVRSMLDEYEYSILTE